MAKAAKKASAAKKEFFGTLATAQISVPVVPIDLSPLAEPITIPTETVLVDKLVGKQGLRKVHSLANLSEKAGSAAAIMHQLLKAGQGTMSASECLRKIRAAGIESMAAKTDEQVLAYIRSERAWIKRTQNFEVTITA
jgi:hypothetical protein